MNKICSNPAMPLVLIRSNISTKSKISTFCKVESNFWGDAGVWASYIISTTLQHITQWTS